jgi:hypothetical protein
VKSKSTEKKAAGGGKKASGGCVCIKKPGQQKAQIGATPIPAEELCQTSFCDNALY